MKLTIIKARTKEELIAAFKIRKEVFVQEQHVTPEEEYDEFEAVSCHFLAIIENQPVSEVEKNFGRGEIGAVCCLVSKERKGNWKRLGKSCFGRCEDLV